MNPQADSNAWLLASPYYSSLLSPHVLMQAVSHHGNPLTAAELQRAGGYMSNPLANAANMQQASNARMRDLLNALSNTPEPKLARARRIAAEVRARKPEMQVKRLIGETI